jgi:hypothetical protein
MVGIVNEETAHDEIQASIMVVERTKGEMVEPWRIVGFEFDHMDRLTPSELRTLGHWLVKEGKRIGREYKSNGARKAEAARP